jgi:hypothetical protein
VLCFVVGWKGAEKGGLIGGTASGGSLEDVGDVLTRSRFSTSE